MSTKYTFDEAMMAAQSSKTTSDMPRFLDANYVPLLSELPDTMTTSIMMRTPARTAVSNGLSKGTLKIIYGLSVLIASGLYFSTTKYVGFENLEQMTKDDMVVVPESSYMSDIPSKESVASEPRAEESELKMSREHLSQHLEETKSDRSSKHQNTVLRKQESFSEKVEESTSAQNLNSRLLKDKERQVEIQNEQNERIVKEKASIASRVAGTNVVFTPEDRLTYELELYERGRTLLSQEEYIKADAEFQNYLERFPYGRMVGAASFARIRVADMQKNIEKLNRLSKIHLKRYNYRNSDVRLFIEKNL